MIRRPPNPTRPDPLFPSTTHVRAVRDHVLVVPAHPADPGGRSVPPLLVQHESLDDQVEGRLFPCRIGEPAVLAQRFDRGGGTRIAEASSDIIGTRQYFLAALALWCTCLSCAPARPCDKLTLGTVCMPTCISRWSPYHLTKTKTT